MADTYGAIELPLPLPPPDGSIGDPLLDYSLAYFQAVLNAKGADAWQTVAPGQNSPPVKTVIPNDPAELIFNERNLPCLYMWRGEGDAPERMAEDIYCTRDKLYVLWVFPPATQDKQSVRSNFVAYITKQLHIAIDLCRDPAWVVDVDPDQSALTYGSVFPRFAGWAEMYMGKWTLRPLVIDMGQGVDKRTYPAYRAVIDVTEVFDFDITKFPKNSVDVTVSNAAGATIAERILTST